MPAHDDRIPVQQLRAFGLRRIPPDYLDLFLFGNENSTVPLHHRLAGQAYAGFDLGF